MKVTVLGAGRWGTAISQVVSQNVEQLTLWDRNEEKIQIMQSKGVNPSFEQAGSFPANVSFTNDIQTAVAEADYIINVISTQYIRSVIEQIKTLDKKTVIINASKGLEIGSKKRISQIIGEIFPDNKYAVISGPSHAEEVAAKMPTTLVAASADQEVAFAVQDLFILPYIRVYAHKDVLGVELASALKNVIALSAGIADGLGYGDNALAALMTRGIMEIKRLGYAMGAMPETFDGLAGIGDLIVTCMSNHSRNRRCGKLLAEDRSLDAAIKEINQSVEGVSTIRAAEVLRQEFQIEMPIVEQLYQVLYGDADIATSVQNLMSRTKKHELDESFITGIW